ncbi:MAG: hypothetical protein CSA65_07670 [Proteobacteria bacterium]|nr:MAG: hypothetical protein CSA65_07670 [Pseudomonadota bacterium]
MHRELLLVFCALLWATACDNSPSVRHDGGANTDGPSFGDSSQPDDGTSPDDGTTPPGDLGPSPTPVCNAVAGGGSVQVAAPQKSTVYKDRWHEAWLGSPAVADLDGDGKNEVIAPRGDQLIVWSADGTLRFKRAAGGRIWSSPVVADLVAAKGLEIVAAARGKIHAWDRQGNTLPGFPVSFTDELRALAAGDIDGDGKLEIVAVTTSPKSGGGKKDIVIAFEADGTTVPGFPPNTGGSSGCTTKCYVTGGYDQNLALGDITGDGRAEIFATQDNAYLSLHDGSGRAFDAASIFKDKDKFLGIRFFLDYALAQQGWSPDEQNDNQAHFTNSAPAIADLDGDGEGELIVLGSVQNAAQSDRERGVVLFVLKPDGTRPAGWQAPFHAKDFIAGLWDYAGTNVVGATNQVTVADVDPSAGPELLFAGFDGRIHCVSADNKELWKTRYTSSDRVLTGGVVVADLSGDGRPEVVFNSYSPDEGKSHLIVLDAKGKLLHKIKLPKRGAMPVPTIADIDGDGTLEILVSLKDGEDKVQQLIAYTVPGSSDNCLLWPTGRGNLRRDGWVP